MGETVKQVTNRWARPHVGRTGALVRPGEKWGQWFVKFDNAEVSAHCRANMAHTRQTMPDSGLGFQVKVLKTVGAVACQVDNEEVGFSPRESGPLMA